MMKHQRSDAKIVTYRKIFGRNYISNKYSSKYDDVYRTRCRAK